MSALFFFLICIGAWVTCTVITEISQNSLNIQNEFISPRLHFQNISLAISDLETNIISKQSLEIKRERQELIKKISRINQDFSNDSLKNHPLKKDFMTYLNDFSKFKKLQIKNKNIIRKLAQLKKIKLLIVNMNEYSNLNGMEKLNNFSILNQKKISYLLSFFAVILMVALIGSFFFRRLINCTHEEITNKEAQLFNNSRLASLGEMASGIAHEINNPLTIISGNARSVKRMIQNGKIDQEAILKSLTRVDETVRRISKIIKGMRTVARQSHEADKMNYIQLTELIDDSLFLCTEKYNASGIDIIIDMDNDTKKAEFLCHHIRISQALVAILNNSFDAIEELETKWIKIHVKIDLKSFEVRVTDSGSGIPTNIAKNIFNPFYTTKEVGKGTGLGMSITHSIVTDHGGTITIDRSSPNTCFVINIPIIAENEVKIAS